MDLRVTLGRLKLKNPVTVASGTFGYAREFQDLLCLSELGAVITKTITRKPRPGNPPPRLCETPAGMLNAIGLQNEGLDNFIKSKLPDLNTIGTKIIVSVSATSEKDFIFCGQQLEAAGVEAIELNLSCPNISYKSSAKGKKRDSELMFAQDAKATFRLVNAVRRKTKLLIIAKLSPHVTDIADIACAAEEAGTDVVSLINTFPAMAIDINSFRPRLAHGSGGLSGPAIRPIAVRMVYEVARRVSVPIIGAGGIISAEDAVEFIVAGATAVSIGTANFVNPTVAHEIISGIKRYCQQHKIKHVRELIGKVTI